MIAGLKGLLGWRHGKSCQKAKQDSELPPDVHELLNAARDVLDSLNAFAEGVILCAMECDPDWQSRWDAEARKWDDETQIRTLQEAVRRKTGALWPTSSCDPLRAINWCYVVAKINRAAASLDHKWAGIDDGTD